MCGAIHTLLCAWGAHVVLVAGSCTPCATAVLPAWRLTARAARGDQVKDGDQVKVVQAEGLGQGQALVEVHVSWKVADAAEDAAHLLSLLLKAAVLPPPSSPLQAPAPPPKPLHSWQPSSSLHLREDEPAPFRTLPPQTPFTYGKPHDPTLLPSAPSPLISGQRGPLGGNPR